MLAKLIYLDSGAFYEGNFSLQTLSGNGKRTDESGTSFEGSVSTVHKGKTTYSDGTIFEGTIVNDEKVGEGKLTLPNGAVFKST